MVASKFRKTIIYRKFYKPTRGYINKPPYCIIKIFTKTTPYNTVVYTTVSGIITGHSNPNPENPQKC